MVFSAAGLSAWFLGTTTLVTTPRMLRVEFVHPRNFRRAEFAPVRLVPKLPLAISLFDVAGNGQTSTTAIRRPAL
jgi:hypothetical protein